ncbi:MAG: bifunctional glutamate N-acetyltransferase/amino-acid acetyltransferase ArgJ [Bacteroidetes bacterium]|nr:bifunctional glutamate N-acetyltransferase/amino-acid acetyltransferase ArgJ [Bacteroidota bacterium]
MEMVQEGVTAPLGYQAAGIHCGVKKARKDLALIYTDTPAHAAAMFTTNSVVAAPVVVDRIQLERSAVVRAILVNSGNANACTGERGLNDAWAMVKATAAALGIAESEVLVSSTGVIGQYLPIDSILTGVPLAVERLGADGTGAAEAIRTTDTFSKEAAVRCMVGGTRVTVGGMAKGSGMIAPNMATMLAFVTTDARITPEVLRSATRQAVDRSFHRISVDGDTSTNDMVAVLANGCAENPVIDSEQGPGYAAFYEALEHVLVALAKMIVTDGEGATKFVEISVTDAATEEEAAKAARAVANSNLVKTALNGEDANWGRILAAIGNAGITFDPAHVEIRFGNVPILRPNYLIDFSEEDAKEVLSRKDILITIRLHRGTASALFWTCDLSREYVTINANYRT